MANSLLPRDSPDVPSVMNMLKGLEPVPRGRTVVKESESSVAELPVHRCPLNSLSERGSFLRAGIPCVQRVRCMRAGVMSARDPGIEVSVFSVQARWLVLG